MQEANLISKNKSCPPVAGDPSVANPTVAPPSRYSGMGAIPEASFELDEGLCEILVFVFLNNSFSSGDVCTR